jgi:hypothetical protein
MGPGPNPNLEESVSWKEVDKELPEEGQDVLWFLPEEEHCYPGFLVIPERIEGEVDVDPFVLVCWEAPNQGASFDIYDLPFTHWHEYPEVPEE